MQHRSWGTGLVRDAAGRVLLVQTTTAGWELPGGRVAVERLCGVYSHLGPRPSVLMVFRCRHRSGAVVPGDDSLAARWFTSHETLQAVTHVSEYVRL